MKKGGGGGRKGLLDEMNPTCYFCFPTAEGVKKRKKKKRIAGGRSVAVVVGRRW